jgi:hypothetical protein
MTGLGKTTLAHVVAAHCGFRVSEMNASDDRSSATLRSRLVSAMQISSQLLALYSLLHGDVVAPSNVWGRSCSLLACFPSFLPS